MSERGKACSLCLALALAACGGNRTSVLGQPDAGAEIPDAGAPEIDAGTPDAGAPDAGPVSTLRAGAARVEVTPGTDTPLGGYGSVPRRRNDPVGIALQLDAARGHCADPNRARPADFFNHAQGTLDPLYVRAVVLDDGVHRAALVKLDAVGMTRQLHDDLLLVAADLGVPAELFAAVATHTHGGPATLSRQFLWEMIGTDCYSEVAYQRLRGRAEAALRAAAANLRPARLGIATTSLRGASDNRRGRPGIYDPELALFKIEDAQGAPLVAWWNFAIHGTVYGADNMKFSADVMGEAERQIEAGLPGAMALFTNAAEGDVSPQGGMQAAALMAQSVLGLWPQVATQASLDMEGVFEDVQMPPPSFHPGCVPLLGGGGPSLCDVLPGFSPSVKLDPSWLSTKGPFKALRLGRVALAFVPGEPITELGWRIKQAGATLGFDHTFVFGLANDHLSYFTTREEYQRGEYEGMSTLYGEGTGDAVVTAAARQLSRLTPPPRIAPDPTTRP